ncbi:hypothetical protein ACFE04_023306 [Oxalis oulophora]
MEGCAAEYSVREGSRAKATSASALSGLGIGRAVGHGIPTTPLLQAQPGLSGPVRGLGGPAPGMMQPIDCWVLGGAVAGVSLSSPSGSVGERGDCEVSVRGVENQKRKRGYDCVAKERVAARLKEEEGDGGGVRIR